MEQTSHAEGLFAPLRLEGKPDPDHSWRVTIKQTLNQTLTLKTVPMVMTKVNWDKLHPLLSWQNLKQGFSWKIKIGPHYLHIYYEESPKKLLFSV